MKTKKLRASTVVKILEDELKEHFPGTEFTFEITDERKGKRITITWNNFPTGKRVERIVKPYEIIHRDSDGYTITRANRFIWLVQNLDMAIHKEVHAMLPKPAFRPGHTRAYENALEELYEKRYKNTVENPTALHRD